MSTQVRLAGESDFEAIIELGRRASDEAPAYARRALDPERCRRSLGLNLSEGFILVSEADGVMVGYLLALICPRPFHEGMEGVVAGLAVMPEARGGPSFIELVSRFQAICEAEGCDGSGITVSSGLHVRETASILERMGMPIVGSSHYVDFQDR